MTLTVRKVTAPAYWASALVNGDPSGLSTDEVIHLNAWRKRELGPRDSVADCDDEARFTWFYPLYDPLATCLSGDVLEYTILRED